jgi:hypothetical protein
MVSLIDEAGLRVPTRRASQFYSLMALACAAIAFLGFLPTYWMPMARGALSVAPVIHVHALVFFSWTVLFLVQTRLVATGRIARHRAFGLAGISVATAMVLLAVLTVIRQMQNAAAVGQLEAGKAFAIVPLAGIAFFGVVFGLAIANISRPEWHKRLMLLATISILDAPVARWFLMLLAPPGAHGPPPVAVDLLPSATAYLLLVIAMVFDWRTRGRPHQVYVAGGLALAAIKLLQLPISTTALWKSFAGAVLALAG